MSSEQSRQIGSKTLRSWRTLSLIVLVLAIGVSGYLSYLKASDAKAMCVSGAKFDCGTVLNSVYSEQFGIPIAWWGLATNLVITALLLTEQRVTFLQRNGTVIVFMIVLFAFLYSVYLVYLQAAVIKAYCPWCLTHEALITILFGIIGSHTWKTMRDTAD